MEDGIHRKVFGGVRPDRRVERGEEGEKKEGVDSRFLLCADWDSITTSFAVYSRTFTTKIGVRGKKVGMMLISLVLTHMSMRTI